MRSHGREPGFGVVGQIMDEEKQREAGMTSRLLDMSHVRIRDLAKFDHPRLAQAQRDLVELVESRRVVAGFGSAI
jgi:hypothetical protein